MESRQFEIAKKYILYREKRRQLRSQKEAYLDIKDVIDTYLDQADWRVNENANMTHSFQGLMLHLSGTVQARYALENIPKKSASPTNTAISTFTTFRSVWPVIARVGPCATSYWKDSIWKDALQPVRPSISTLHSDR